MIKTLEICEHIEAVDNILRPKVYECEVCVKIGGTWNHLRTCQTCGITLCCDSSPNRHARKHANAKQHPVIISAEPDERWIYCYIDDVTSSY